MGYLIAIVIILVLLVVVWLCIALILKREDRRIKGMSPEVYREFQAEMRKKQM